MEDCKTGKPSGVLQDPEHGVAGPRNRLFELEPVELMRIARDRGASREPLFTVLLEPFKAWL